MQWHRPYWKAIRRNLSNVLACLGTQFNLNEGYSLPESHFQISLNSIFWVFGWITECNYYFQYWSSFIGISFLALPIKLTIIPGSSKTSSQIVSKTVSKLRVTSVIYLTQALALPFKYFFRQRNFSVYVNILHTNMVYHHRI